MTRSGYVPDPSGWMFLTGDGITVGAALPDDAPLLVELWELISSAADASSVLDALTRGGISSAPDFVIAVLGSPGKVLVRGAATVTVGGSEQKAVSGSGFSSWAELVVDRLDDFVCEIAAAPHALLLPILGGTVRAALFAADAAGVVAFATVGSADAAAEPDTSQAVTPPVAKAPAHAARPPRAAAPASRASAPSEATVAAIDEVDDGALDVTAALGAPNRPNSYDDLFGDTSFRSVEDAAVRPVDDGAASPGGTGIEDRTVVASDLAQLRAARRAGRGRPAGDAVAAPLFFVELSTGGRELLDQPLVIGRAPSASALAGDRIPRLVTMTTPNQDISRTHAQISVEGGTVVVTDLHSRNGTLVTLPGRAAQKLREGETTPVIAGTVIDLGDGATLTVRES